jgi:hypothetical protein
LKSSIATQDAATMGLLTFAIKMGRQVKFVDRFFALRFVGLGSFALQRSGRSSCLFIGLLAVVLTATVAQGITFNVLQVEADYVGNETDGLQYAPVNFAGSTTLASGGVTYHALSSPGSGTVSTYSAHAAIVRSRLLAADGPANPVTDIWCLYAGNFLNNYVGTAAPASNAFRPSTVGNNIKYVNNSWVTSYTTTEANIDAVRRLDYMIHREDLVMTNGAVSPWPGPTPLLWASRNSIAVRGTQGFDFSDATGIGKRHADLWGPKAGTADDFSSYETPGVLGSAAGLVKAADTYSLNWNNGTNGLRHEVVKSILMTGADKTAFTATTGGFGSWTNNGVNNLDNDDGAGRVDYAQSLAVLDGGPRTLATVTGTTISAPIVTTAIAGWNYDSVLNAGSKALVIDANAGQLSKLTATLAWDVSQTEVGDLRLDTTDNGVQFANLDLELRPVTYNGVAYTLGPSLGSSLGLAGLRSQSTDDNVEHLYFTDTLSPGLYAFVISNNSSFAWNYGFSYTYAIPEPASLVLLFMGFVSLGSFAVRKRLQSRRRLR